MSKNDYLKELLNMQYGAYIHEYPSIINISCKLLIMEQHLYNEAIVKKHEYALIPWEYLNKILNDFGISADNTLDIMEFKIYIHRKIDANMYCILYTMNTDIIAILGLLLVIKRFIEIELKRPH